jgi:hypothetical protein
MRAFAHSIVAAERRESDHTDSDGHAAFRVCEKLRSSLSALAGPVGFSTLLKRALTLARAEVPWLAQLSVGPTGSLSIPDASDEDARPSEAAKGGVALVAHLLELLSTLIGDALTLRLVQQIWPKSALDDPKSGGKT